MSRPIRHHVVKKVPTKRPRLELRVPRLREEREAAARKKRPSRIRELAREVSRVSQEMLAREPTSHELRAAMRDPRSDLRSAIELRGRDLPSPRAPVRSDSGDAP